MPLLNTITPFTGAGCSVKVATPEPIAGTNVAAANPTSGVGPSRALIIQLSFSLTRLSGD
jgi:hypothetical protein